MMGELDKNRFILAYTLGVVAQMEPVITAAGLALAAEEITSHWATVATEIRDE